MSERVYIDIVFIASQLFDTEARQTIHCLEDAIRSHLWWGHGGAIRVRPLFWVCAARR